LAGSRGFARALQTDHHDRHRRRRVKVDLLRVRAQRLDELVVHDLDDHLAGRDGLDDGDADRALAHLVDEGAGYIERDVGLDEGAAHLAQRGVDISLGERTAAGEPVEDAGQSFRQAVEH
jgi:hypothetical protein